MRNLIIVFSLVIITISCTTYNYLSPKNLSETQEQIYIQGYPGVADYFLFSEDSGLIVKIFGYTNSKILILELYYGNATHNHVNVIPDDIEVIGISNRSSHKIKVWEANEYIRRVKRQQNTALMLQAISGSINAANAGYSRSNTQGYYSGTYNGRTSGYYSGNYFSTTSTYDSSKVAEANARNISQIQSQSQAYQNNIQYLEQVLLKRTTLRPKYYIEGSVYVDKILYDQYIVKVPFAGKLFTFHFDLKK